MRDGWKVYVLKPRASGKEGGNFRLKAVPPPDLAATGVQVIRKTSEHSDRRAAERRAADMERALNSTVIVMGDPLVLDVLEKHRDYRAADEETPESTVWAYTHALRRLGGPLQGLKASQLTRASVLQARDAVRLEVGPGTTNQTMACLSHAWGWAHDREWVSEPFPRIKRLPQKATKKRPMTDGEVDQVLVWISGYQGGRWLPLFALVADTGARVGELLALRGRDVDRSTGLVRLAKTKRHEARTLAPPAATLAMIPERDPDALIFQAVRPRCRKDSPMKTRVPLAVFWRACESLGLEDVDQHSFRRAWISSSLEAGVPLHVSMRATGHTSAAVHMGYARRATHDLSSAVQKVRARRGSRAWEPTAPDTAPHRPNRAVDTGVKSSAFQPESRVPASCCSEPLEPQESHHECVASCVTAPIQPAQAEARKKGLLLRLGGGHPRSDRIARLYAIDPEAALDLACDPVVQAGIRAAIVDGSGLEAPAASRLSGGS